MSDSLEIKKTHYLKMRTVDGKEEIWRDIDYDEAVDKINKVASGKSIKGETYYLNANHVVMARIDSYD